MEKKCRRFDNGTLSELTWQEWNQFLKQPGCDGGASSTLIACDEREDTCISERHAQFKGVPRRHVRYLGGWPAMTGTNQKEVDMRCNASKKGWLVLGKLWHDETIWTKTRLLLWYCLCRNTSMSGLEQLVMTKYQEDKLEKLQCKQLRTINCGDGNIVNGHMLRLTNEQLRIIHGVPTIVSEMRYRRLKWLRNMVRFLDDHGL